MRYCWPLTCWHLKSSCQAICRRLIWELDGESRLRQSFESPASRPGDGTNSGDCVFAAPPLHCHRRLGRSRVGPGVPVAGAACPASYRGVTGRPHPPPPAAWHRQPSARRSPAARYLPGAAELGGGPPSVVSGCSPSSHYSRTAAGDCRSQRVQAAAGPAKIDSRCAAVATAPLVPPPGCPPAARSSAQQVG